VDLAVARSSLGEGVAPDLRRHASAAAVEAVLAYTRQRAYVQRARQLLKLAAVGDRAKPEQQRSNAPARAEYEDKPRREHTAHPNEAIAVAAVDDHPVILHGLAGILSTLPDLDVVATATSLDDLMSGPGRNAEVVLLDLDLGDGTNVTTNIHRLLKAGSAVVVFSAFARPDNVRAAVRAGACGYVPKSDDIDGLATAIRAAATGGGWVSPQLAFVLLTDDAPDRPSLSAKEQEALQLYAAGMPMKAVARRMNVGIETAKQYIERVRIKYRKLGRDTTTRVDLYRRAVEDGHLHPD
jgi:DNA-binding NarL/FixJ family response regulator